MRIQLNLFYVDTHFVKEMWPEACQDMFSMTNLLHWVSDNASQVVSHDRLNLQCGLSMQVGLSSK